jgi:prophage regulatory protein
MSSIGLSTLGTEAPKPRRLVREKEVLRMVPFGRSSLWSYVQGKTFPAPIRIGPRSIAWLESDIDDWIAERVAESRGASQTAPEPAGAGNSNAALDGECRPPERVNRGIPSSRFNAGKSGLLPAREPR